MLKKITSTEAQAFYLFLIIGAWFMGLFSYTSPIYYFDYSPDNNAFFTVGKAMMRGIIPYKDLFEQKGPYLYLLHGIASLFAGHSLIGMFPFEVISLTMTIWCTYKITKLFVKDIPAIVIATFSPFLYLFHPYFNYGDTTESLLFPFTVYLLYLVIKNEQFSVENEAQRFQFTNLQWLGLGFTVALIFLTKYTQLGSWIIFYLFILGYFIKMKQWHEVIKMAIWSLGGFIIGTLPWLIYFLVTKSLSSFIHVYFYDNIKIYATSGNAFISNILQAFNVYSEFIKSNPIIFLLGFIGMGYLIMSNTIFKTLLGKSTFLMMNFGNAVLAIYGYTVNQAYLYYELAFIPYLLIPIIAIMVVGFKYYSQKTIKLSSKQIERHNGVLVFLTVILSFILVLSVNNNFTNSKLFPNNPSVMLSGSRKYHHQPAQIIFGKIIRETTGTNTTLLNYGSIDMGFYTASGVLPSNYYFQNYNISEKNHPNIIISQIKLVVDRKMEWVVLDTEKGISIKHWNGAFGNNGKISSGNLNTGTSNLYKRGLHRNYYVVTKHSQLFEGTDVTYWLLRKRAMPLTN